jgi:hypothetical protein
MRLVTHWSNSVQLTKAPSPAARTNPMSRFLGRLSAGHSQPLVLESLLLLLLLVVMVSMSEAKWAAVEYTLGSRVYAAATATLRSKSVSSLFRSSSPVADLQVFGGFLVGLMSTLKPVYGD